VVRERFPPRQGKVRTGRGKDDLTDDDLAHMRTVHGFVQRHLAQRPTKEDVEASRWRCSLMNWGHDPLKTS
jgi:hypothetical protein